MQFNILSRRLKQKEWARIRQPLQCKVVPIVSLIFVALTQIACPTGIGSKKFTNDSLTKQKVVSSKRWRTPQVVDIGITDPTSTSLNHDQDISDSSQRFGGAVFNDGLRSFYVFFNRADQPPTGVPANNFGYVTQSVSFDNDIWATSLNQFTQIDFHSQIISPGVDTVRPLSTVDSSGNAYLLYFTKVTETNPKRRPMVIRHPYSLGSWTVPERIAANDVDTDVSSYAAIATDPNNNVVVVWYQNAKAYFNEYRPSQGWRFLAKNANTTYTVWHDTDGTVDSIKDLGMDIAFDSYGNGYGAYIAYTGAAKGRVMLTRWKGNKDARFVSADSDTHSNLLSLPTVDDMFPRLYVNSTGGATVFFWRNFSSPNAELYYSTAADTDSSTAASFGTATRFDSAVGTGTCSVLIDGQDYLPPVLAYKGKFAAVGFLKSDGSTTRLWVSRYADGQWYTPKAIDLAYGNVTWTDLSVSKAGDVAAVYSMIGKDGFEHVYGNMFISEWQGSEQLDNFTNFASISATTKTRPSVSIDEQGNAVARFTIPDASAFFTPTRRRVGVAAYR